MWVNKEAAMRKVFGLFAAGAIGICSSALGQQPGPQPAQPLPATTVQLPTFSYFTVNTTVSVPDRGGAYLGGVNRARDGSWSRGFGPLANRSLGGDRMASGVSVHATIIDHEELDRAVLAEAAAKRVPADPAVVKAESLARHVGRADGGSAGASPSHSVSPSHASPSLATESVAAIKARNAAAAEERASEAAGYFVKAQGAEAEGKTGVAKIYYQMAMRRGTGELKQRAEQRIAAINAAQTTVAKR
jgi:hypothetical protein